MAEVPRSQFEIASSIIDSSRVSTFLISILLIVYGSFRSLNLEREAKEKQIQSEKEGKILPENFSGVQTLDTVQALCLPLGASISLLVMFFFFDSMQLLFAICTAVIATVALAFLLLPMCEYICRPCFGTGKFSFGFCGRFTSAELLAFSLSVCIVCIWTLTGHWLLMDAMGMGLCVAFIAFVRLPSLKVSTLLLAGLLVYDVFWVFFSSYIFSANVMVRVATRSADNPVNFFAKKLHISGSHHEKLALPGKLLFPSSQRGHFSMLGLGDITFPFRRLPYPKLFPMHEPRSNHVQSIIAFEVLLTPNHIRNGLVMHQVMPGLLLCFVLRYDAYKKAQMVGVSAGVPPPPSHLSKISYFQSTLIGYFLGLITATVSSEVFKAAQPALLYLVPFTLLPLLTMAYMKGDLRRMWSEPFTVQKPVRDQEV